MELGHRPVTRKISYRYMKKEKQKKVKRNLLHHQEWRSRDRSCADMYGQMLRIIVPSILTTIAYMIQ
jgi:hypothetical protein